MRPRKLVFALFCSLAYSQTDPAPADQPPVVSLPADLNRVLRDFEKAYASKDGAAVASLFLPDGMEMLANRPPVRGRDAVEKFYSGASQSIVFRPFVFAESGDVAFIIGGYSPAPGGGADANKFVFTLRKVDGKWLIESAMSNSNRPQQPRPRPAGQE